VFPSPSRRPVRTELQGRLAHGADRRIRRFCRRDRVSRDRVMRYLMTRTSNSPRCSSTVTFTSSGWRSNSRSTCPERKAADFAAADT